MTTVSVRLSDDELAYLEAISKNIKNTPSSKKITTSPGKSLKQLIAWCVDNKINIDAPDTNPSDSSRKLLEELHVMIPHILYLSRLHILMDSDKIPDDKVAQAKQQAIDYINSVCAEFKQTQYHEINTILNEIGFPQLTVGAIAVD